MAIDDILIYREAENKIEFMINKLFEICLIHFEIYSTSRIINAEFSGI